MKHGTNVKGQTLLEEQLEASLEPRNPWWKNVSGQSKEEWRKDCKQWRGRVLLGKKGHYCYAWDGLPVDETSPEWPCKCFEKDASKRGTTVITTGRKNDAGKLRWSLLPMKWLEGTIRVLMHGAEKYAVRNWLDFPVTPETLERFSDAADRHWRACRIGDTEKSENAIDILWTLDEDSGLPVIDHLICELMFLRTYMGRYKKENPPNEDHQEA